MSERLLRRLFPLDEHHAAGFHRVIQQALPERGRVLDLGCGANRELAPYRSEYRQIWGTDFAAHPELDSPRWFRPLRDSGVIPFPDGYFDAVVSVMVLEHVADPELYFSEIARVLRPGGAFVGHSVSGMHYVTAIRRLFGLLPHRVSQVLVKRLYGRAETDTFPAYYRLNTLETLRRQALTVGLDPRELHRYADPGYFRFNLPLMSLAVVADKLLEQFRAGWGRLYFTFVAEKPLTHRKQKGPRQQSKRTKSGGLRRMRLEG